MVYIVHANYGSINDGWCTVYINLVRCPDGSAKQLTAEQLWPFLRGKAWRLAE